MRANARLKVAVIDDDPASMRAVAAALSHACDVAIFGSGDDLLNRLRSGRRYDAIVSDVLMPVTGMALWEQIRTISESQAARVVFLTGGGLPRKLEVFVRRHTWLEKPVDADVLLDTIRKVAQKPKSDPPGG